MEREAAVWRYQELHKDAPYHDGTLKNWAATRSLGFPYHYADGVAVTIAGADLRPDDDFLGVVDSDGVDDQESVEHSE